jgi:hypothetical protein
MSDNVTNAEFTLWKQQLADQGELIKEVRESQRKIETALLGSLDSATGGLFGQVRDQGKELKAVCQATHSHTATIATHSTEIHELQDFKRDTKRVVAFIAVTIPFSFEIIKFVGGLVWAYLKTTHIP